MEKIINILNRNGQESATREFVIKCKTLTGVELANKFNDYFTNLFSPVQLESGDLCLTQRKAENCFLFSTDDCEVLSGLLNLKISTFTVFKV